jgi:hypothetical protein
MDHVLPRQKPMNYFNVTCRTKPPPDLKKNPYDQYVQHAIDSQGDKYTHRAINSHGNITPLDESPDLPQPVHGTTAKVRQKVDPVTSGGGVDIDSGAEIQRQWQWSIAEEMLPAASDERTSQILDEVGRMEVWMDSVADKVKIVKSKLDDMEEEGGTVLHLKDSK